MNKNLNLVKAIIIIGIVFLWWMFFYIGWFPNYSDGERTGEIYKFSKKGLIWKSWEGSMYLGGISKNSEGGLVLDKFYFSIPEIEETEKAQLIEKLKECGRQRKICTIEYQQWFKSPIQVDSRYKVVNVK